MIAKATKDEEILKLVGIITSGQSLSDYNKSVSKTYNKSTSKTCPKCGKSYECNKVKDFCPDCGTAYSATTIKCKKCNNENDIKFKYCTGCGAKI